MEKYNDFIKTVCITIFTGVVAYFDSTSSYIIALIFGFLFNIFAGFRADDVKIRLHRIFPPLMILQNFKGNKFKDSLMELFLITGLTYMLKGLIDLMDFQDHSKYIVQWLIIIAIYYYLRNGLRNLSIVYKNSKWIKMLYILLAFKFRELAGGDMADIIEQAEKNEQIIKERETKCN